MALTTGTRIGPYEITGSLGAGGMGEVYRARDPRLGREVAVKVLPERVAGDVDARARFEREARAVAALSHPNILAIHDFAVEENRAYTVTEMLEGETLRQRLDGSPLPVRKVLDYGAQIARGLAAAHDKGIVHRDLKPENVFITHDGRAKILDFGLAKMEAAPEAGLTASPTLDAGTRPGTVMGSMGYMSPEQVRGQAVDARSDIFAFGAVLYEMLSGKRAFARATQADTMSAVLKEDPPGVSAMSNEIPPALQRIVEHCLEKKPAERFQSARDLAFHLDAVGTVSSTSAMEVPAIGSGRSLRGLRAAGLFAAGLFAGAAIGAFFTARIVRPAHVEPPSIRYLSYSGADSQPSASRDGKLIAYTSVRDGRSEIWIKQYLGGDEANLTRGPGDVLPRISPDGSQVLFTRSQGGHSALFRIPVVGGEPRKVLDDAEDGDWSPDGTQIAFLRERPGTDGLSYTLGVATASGEDSREVTTVKLAFAFSPRWSPDGKTIVLGKAGTENSPNTLLLVPVDGGEIRTLTPPPPQGTVSSAVWAEGGRSLLYSQSGSIANTAVSASLGSGRLILQHIDTGEAEVKMWLPNSVGVIDSLRNGMIIMGVSAPRQSLVETPLASGKVTGNPKWLTRGNSSDRQPVFSPDGKWVLFSSNRGGNLDLWKLEVATGAIRRVTDDDADDWDPGFTPDGRSIIWSSNRSGHFEIWICAADGTGARQLTQDGFDAENPTATHDGRWVVYNSANPAHSGLWKIHPDGSGAALLVPGSWSTPDVSPDGRYVAFRTASLPRTLVVARVDDGQTVGRRLELPGPSQNGRPRWSPDGSHVLYTASDATGARGIYVQEFSPGKDTSATRKPVMPFVLEETPESFGVSPDGTRFVYSADESIDSLMLAQGIAGIAPAAPKP